jgi:hypothetical protein
MHFHGAMLKHKDSFSYIYELYNIKQKYDYKWQMMQKEVVVLILRQYPTPFLEEFKAN